MSQGYKLINTDYGETNDGENHGFTRRKCCSSWCNILFGHSLNFYWSRRSSTDLKELKIFFLIQLMSSLI